MDEKIKLRKGEELVLTVPGKASVSGRGRSRGRAKKPPTGVRPRRGEYLPRRKSGTSLSFYDAGQILNTETHVFEDNSFPLQPELANDLPWRTPLDFAGIDAGQWTAIAAQLTGVPSRKDRFKRIEKPEAAKYGIQIAINDGDFEELDADNPKLLDDGYKADGAVSRLRLAHFGIGFDVDTSGPVKVTADPLFSADPVSFGFSGKASIFIAPAIGMFSASGAADGNFNWAGNYYDQFPRELLSVEGYGSFFSGEVSSPSNDALLNHWLGKARDNDLNRYYFTIDTDHFFSGGSVPDAGAGLTGQGLFYIVAGQVGGPVNNVFGDTNARHGTLLLMVEAGSRTFYVWSDEDRVGEHARFSVLQEL